MVAKWLRIPMMVVALALVLAACGGDDPADDPADDPVDDADAADDDAAGDDGAEDEADGDDGEADDNAGADEFEEVTLFVASNLTHVPAFAALERGIWADLGLDVDLQILSSGADIMTGLSSGEAEFGAVNAATGVPSGRASGVDVKLVVPYANDATDARYVGRIGIIARADSGIDPDDASTFVGKTVGVLEGSTTDQYFRSFLAENDVDVEDVELLNVPVQEMRITVIQGQVDAVVPWEPATTQTIQDLGDEAVVVSRGESFVADVIGLGATEEGLAENEEIFERFILGLVEAAQWTRQNPDDAAQLSLNFISGISFDVAREALEHQKFDTRVSVCTEEAVTRTAQELIDFGRIEADGFTVDDLIDASILNRVTEENPQFFDDLPPVPETLEDCAGVG